MAKKNIKLSVAIAVFNEEKNLEECLTSVVAFADEIIVVDGGSSDATVSIVRKFTSHIIETDNPSMFHINKQKALDACSGDWILQIDADERVTPSLKNEILTVINSGKSGSNGYFIPRRNYFWGHWMRKGGQYPDYVMRLVRRGKSHFPAKSVHEQIEVIGEPGYLTQAMDHISYRTREDYWKKADTYTTLTAIEMKKNGVHKNAWTWLTYNIIKPKITFLSLFIRHKGFMDGWYGLVFAYFSALHFPIAYKKFVKLLLVIIFFLLCTFPVHAEYVMPYPSYMPGNTMYRVSRILDRLKYYWFWGNIAQIKYHLALSDKYLIEAKTLMEYKQFLLGTDALRRSDKEFMQVPAYIAGAKKEGVDVTKLQQLVTSASDKHVEILTDLLANTPAQFTWTPEKAPSTDLHLADTLKTSIGVRRLWRP